MEVYFNPSKFPICECCGYEDPIIINHEDFLKFNNEITAKDPDASVYEACREKYVYPSEHFSKKAYNDMLKYAEEKKRRTQEEYDRICHTPKCPTCGSTDLRKVSVGAKAVSVGLFGIFSQKVKKTWHCNSCGYEW
jgi:hypothetical protein